MRTIEAPGVEIREIDKSQYAPAIVGTAALVMGFANKGEDYTAMEMTSRSAWVNYYGEPDNEAERYFYTACMEVINQNGKLYCAKIPYENEARDKYVCKKYTISTKINNISAVIDYVNGTGTVDDPSLLNLLEGDFTPYGYGLSDMPGIPSISGYSDEARDVLSTYATTIANIESYKNTLVLWNKARNLKNIALPVFYKYTETEEDDNWWYFNLDNVYQRIENLFNPSCDFWQTAWKPTSDGGFGDSYLHFSNLNLTELNNYIADQFNISANVSAEAPYEPAVYTSAFFDGFIGTFGETVNEFTPWNFVFEKLDVDYVDTDGKFFRKFIKDNIRLFDEINKCVYTLSNETEIYPRDQLSITYFDTVNNVVVDDPTTIPGYVDGYNDDVDTDRYKIYKPVYHLSSIVAGNNVPYIYGDLRDGREYCNLLAYNTAITNKFEVKKVDLQSLVKILKDLNTLVNLSCIEDIYTKEGGTTEYPSFGSIFDLTEISAPVAPGSSDGQPVIHYTDIGTNSPFIDLSRFGETSAVAGKNLFENSLPLSVNRTNAKDGVFEDDETLGVSQKQLTEIINDLEAYINGKYSEVFKFQNDLITTGRNVTTNYVLDLMNYYATNVRIDSFWDSSRLYEDNVVLDVLKQTTVVSVDADEVPVIDDVTGEEIRQLSDVSFFDTYGNVVDVYSDEYITELSAKDERRAGNLKMLRDFGKAAPYEYQLEGLITEFNKSLTKSKLIRYVESIRSSDAFKEIEEYLAASPTTAALYNKFTKEEIEKTLVYSEIRDVDDSIQQYFKIKASPYVFTYALSAIDEYKTDEDVVAPNTIMIADMTRSRYVRAADINETECIGIVPIITTAANALIAQNFIEVSEMNPGISYSVYQPLSSIGNLPYTFKDKGKWHDHNEFIINGNKEAAAQGLNIQEISPARHQVFADPTCYYQQEYNLSDFCAKEFFSSDPEEETISQQLNGYFSTIQYTDTGKLDRDNMYDIGVIVLKAYLDAAEGNKISFAPIESFVGSLDRNAVNPNTGVTKFIDTIVNSQSEYINLFSNCYASTATRKKYDEECDILIVEPQKAGVLGFYEDMCVEDISLSKSIYDGLAKVFDKNQDINEKEIDIVCDAGISNIAQFTKAVYGKGKGQYDPACVDAAMFKLKSRQDTLTWRDIIQKYDNFCKNVRKDCMFIADGLRPFCLQGQKKIVRPTKPANSIDVNLLPYIKYMTGLNTNYGAGYCDWFQKADEFTGEYFWCPPSIQAMGIYIYTDVHAEYWDAPAGLNRGIVPALDVAFSPTMRQAGTIYNNNWNYAINYPQDGIVLEGQKTFQVKPSAFDRVNVRRLFLRLERATYKVARYFVYEGNTAYTRQRLIDTIDPIFADVKLRNGIYDYKIICDESINTPDVIDRNELKVKIGIKPVKTAEFILIDFIALTTGGSFDEM